MLPAGIDLVVYERKLGPVAIQRFAVSDSVTELETQRKEGLS